VKKFVELYHGKNELLFGKILIMPAVQYTKC